MVLRRDTLDPRGRSADRLAREATLAWVLHRYKPKSTSLYGSAGRRTPEQTAAAVALADRTISAIDHDTTIVAYTDGAAQGNPGPAGAGAIITYPGWGPGASSHHTEELSVGVGVSTNNFGELWAIGMVLNDVSQKEGAGYALPAHGIILTDSSYVRGCLVDGWEAKGSNGPLVLALLALLRDSPIPWDITWIPGHAGVPGNEAADGAATRGARVSRAGRALSDLDLRIRNRSFIT
jgi:ribonuclease HI